MKQSGGGIHVRSEPGAGSVFHLRFPVVDGEAEDLEAGAPVRPSLERLTGTVLVVEDDDSVRQVAGRILQRAGFPRPASWRMPSRVSTCWHRTAP